MLKLFRNDSISHVTTVNTARSLAACCKDNEKVAVLCMVTHVAVNANGNTINKKAAYLSLKANTAIYVYARYNTVDYLTL